MLPLPFTIRWYIQPGTIRKVKFYYVHDGFHSYDIIDIKLLLLLANLRLTFCEKVISFKITYRRLVVS